MDRTVKFFEDGTEVISRYTGTHFTYARGKISKLERHGTVVSFSVQCSNGKDKEGKWRDGTFYNCSAFKEKAEEIIDRYSDGDEIEVILQYNPRKGKDGKYYYGHIVKDVPRMKPESEGSSATEDYEEDPNDPLPF